MEQKATIQILENISLKERTTFKIGGVARFFVSVTTKSELAEALAFARARGVNILILGGASNILMDDRGFDGLVISIDNRGREIIGETSEMVFLRVAAGEILDEVVAWTVEHGWWGIENLSLIYGKFGAIAIQNVGAYGQQASDCIQSVDVIETATGQRREFSARECGFDYRKSIFNTSEKGKYVIWDITVGLCKNPKPVLTYPDLKKYFENYSGQPSQAEIRKAIIEIRQRKLPDPIKTPNSGSFFKNIILTPEQYDIARETIGKNFGEEATIRLDDMRNKFSQPNSGKIKIPAGFIMDQLLGLKGMRVGDAQLSEQQVICIINIGNATSDDVRMLYQKVCNIVLEKTGLTLTHEPEFIGS